MNVPKSAAGLRILANQQRKNLIELCRRRGSLHLGGDMSSVEVIEVLFCNVLNIDPSNPSWEDRDRFILSKGHGSGMLYLAMAERGYFSMDEVMETYKGFQTRFGMHPCREVLPVLDASTGSLGHGLSLGVGMALAGRQDGKKHRVFVFLGDGELNEGSNWEAIMSAKHYKLGNLVAIVDHNKFSLDGPLAEVMDISPLSDKWRAFGWNVVSIEDGNNIDHVLETFKMIPDAGSCVPTVFIANTVKGKGVSFMENNYLWHGRTMTDQQVADALAELEEQSRSFEK